MQDMTSEACLEAPLNEQKTLIDGRDNNTYTIVKIQNNTNTTALCWMTQNLRIIDQTITSIDSDVDSDFVVPTSTKSGFTAANQEEPKAYYDSKNRLYGLYYNWYTATAGTGTSSKVSGNAKSSLCPKGWRLPTGGGSREFYQLVNGLSAIELTASPYSFTYSGLVNTNQLSGGGNSGNYWSSTTNSESIAFYLVVSDSNIYPDANRDRYYGLSVRCVAR